MAQAVETFFFVSGNKLTFKAVNDVAFFPRFVPVIPLGETVYAVLEKFFAC